MIRNILIAEDDHDACSTLAQSLALSTEHSLIMYRCTSGEEALEALQKSVASGQRFNAILTDGFLKGAAGGVTLIKTLRDSLPEYADTPIIASSSDKHYFDELVSHPVYGRNLYPIPKLEIGPRQTCWDDDTVADTLKERNVL